MDNYQRIKKACEYLSLREVLEYTRYENLQDGALGILLERIIEEIEKLKEKNES